MPQSYSGAAVVRTMSQVVGRLGLLWVSSKQPDAALGLLVVLTNLLGLGQRVTQRKAGVARSKSATVTGKRGIDSARSSSRSDATQIFTAAVQRVRMTRVCPG